MELSPKKSYLLTDLYRHRHNNYQLADIISHVEKFVRDRRGSKFVQQKLRDAPENRREMVYLEMKPKMISLMMDKFANFVVQRLYEIATNKQREEIFNVIMDNFQLLCSNIYGCRVVQFVMESSTLPELHQILAQLRNKMVDFARHQFAHHILIKCFTSHILPNKDILNFVVFEFGYTIAFECRHQYSCRVFQEILEHGTIQQKSIILDQIIPATADIAAHRYGNYVIQSALRSGTTDRAILTYKAAILAVLKNNFWEMSENKYASNVVEKFLDFEPTLHQMIGEVFEDMMDFPIERIVYLCKQQFANYILQKLVPKLKYFQRLRLMGRIEPYEQTLNRHLGARNIIALLK